MGSALRQVKGKNGEWTDVKVADSIRALIIINLQVWLMLSSSCCKFVRVVTILDKLLEKLLCSAVLACPGFSI